MYTHVYAYVYTHADAQARIERDEWQREMLVKFEADGRDARTKMAAELRQERDDEIELVISKLQACFDDGAIRSDVRWDIRWNIRRDVNSMNIRCDSMRHSMEHSMEHSMRFDGTFD